MAFVFVSELALIHAFIDRAAAARRAISRQQSAFSSALRYLMCIGAEAPTHMALNIHPKLCEQAQLCRFA
jgi:hypothetical protein